MKDYSILSLLSRLLFLCTILFFSGGNYSISAQSDEEGFFFKNLKNSHDLNLPDWGPYSKRYIGISHITDKRNGFRFDLSVFPGFYRRKVNVPNVLYENDYHPWEASPNLEYFSFRHELEWKDQVYTDISYSEISDKARLIRIECVNNTSSNQNLALHFMSSMNFPPLKEYSPYTSIYPSIANLPENTAWHDAVDYKDLIFAKPRPTDNLVYDGKMRGEIRDNGFVNSSAIGLGFGVDENDFVTYNIHVKKNFQDALLLIRYKMNDGDKVSFVLSGLIEKEIMFEGAESFKETTIKIGKIKNGEYQLSFASKGGAALNLDGFVVLESQSLGEVEFTQKEWNPVPSTEEGPVKKFYYSEV